MNKRVDNDQPYHVVLDEEYSSSDKHGINTKYKKILLVIGAFILILTLSLIIYAYVLKRFPLQETPPGTTEQSNIQNT